MINETIYIWLIDGVSTVFSTSESFTTAMATALGFDAVHYGLAHPTGLAAGIELRSGTLEDTSVTLTVEDVDGSLARLFGVSFDESEPLIDSLDPATDPAPAYLWGKHVGTEKIGPAGERRRHSCVPGWNIGMQHWGANQAIAFGLGAAPYSDAPIIWPGRRCAIYRLVRGALTWGDPVRIWWGTMLGQGDLEGRTWSFKCSGPESWLGGNLGNGALKEPLNVESLTRLTEEECVLRGKVQIVYMDEGGPFHNYVLLYEDSSLLTAGGVSYEDVVVAMSTFIDDLKAATGAGDYVDMMWSDSLGSEGIQVRWKRPDDPNDNPAEDWLALRVQIRAHLKVWQTLGYDPLQQNGDRHPVENVDEYASFWESTNGYWAGDFFSADPVIMATYEGLDGYVWELAAETGNIRCYNYGGWRWWPPLAPGGGQSWDMEASGQEFFFRTYDPLYIVGQQTHPLLADPTDPSTPITISDGVGEVNSTGIMVFEGPYRARGGVDGGSKDPAASKAEREGRSKQVARVCWRATADGVVELDSAGLPRLVIAEWLEPKLYGIDWPRLTGSWGGWREPPEGAIANTALPLTTFEADAYKSPVDNVEHVFHLTLSTTGSGAGIGGTAANPTVDIGDNGPALGLDLSADYLDIESSNLGLAIPNVMISNTYKLRSQTGTSALMTCKAAFVGPISARKMISSLIAPVGACVSLQGGKYSLFDPWVFVDLTDDDVDAVLLGPEDYAGEVGDPASARAKQDQREYSPIDRLDVQARIDPTSGSYAKKIEQRSWDKGSQYRNQTVPYKIEGDHLIHPLSSAPGAQWKSDFDNRWRVGTNFWASQHFPVHITVSANRGESIWPGQAIIIADPWLADPTNAKYELDFGIGYVTSRTFNARDERVELSLLVSSVPLRLYAPAVSATRYDEDEEEEGYRLFCEDHLYRWNRLNAGSFGGIKHLGLQGFQPPSWYSADPIDTDIEIFQFDGKTWTRGIYGVVSSVTPGSDIGIADHRNPTGWLNLSGPLTGNPYYRDMHHIVVLLRDGDQTAEWVRVIYGPVCDKDGLSDGTLGNKWV